LPETERRRFGETESMTRQMEFYFDFSSPYGYLASTRIEALAAKHRVPVRWRPVLLGAIFKITGVVPIALVPLKADYFRRDTARLARLLDVPMTIPAQFPFGTVTACRAFYFMERQDPAAAVRLAQALFHAAFAEGRDICPVEQVGAIADGAGFDGDAIMEGIQRADVKEMLKLAVDEAVARGVFGSPYIFADGEPFWGVDRLDQVDQWLSRGGW
jgi:2-hydroxychromene-2-carboxylate isomerase